MSGSYCRFHHYIPGPVLGSISRCKFFLPLCRSFVIFDRLTLSRSNQIDQLAALAITSAQALVSSVYWLCRWISALEVDLNAVERITELLETPQERPMIEEKRPPANWP